MKLTLLSMPWATPNRPSAAIGALAAAVRSGAPWVHTTARHEHPSVAQAMGPLLYANLSVLSSVGEAMYGAFLYGSDPRQTFPAFKKAMSDLMGDKPPAGMPPSWEACHATAMGAIREHLEQLADRIAASCDILGCTTSIAQTLPSLAIAKMVTDRNPDIKVLLGGTGIARSTAASLLQLYPWVSYIIQGEGEGPLVDLLCALRDDGNLERIPGFVHRPGADGTLPPNPPWVPQSLDELPTPDYRDYAEVNGERLNWHIPLEASRGCTRDKSKGGTHLNRKCAFCNYNTATPRAKTPARIAEELVSQASSHKHLHFVFSDLDFPAALAPHIAPLLHQQGIEPSFTCSVRADVKPHHILALKQMGMQFADCGIEGFSPTYLKRLKKGVAVIHNLQVMRTFCELNVPLEFGILTDFPGATDVEVQETVDIIQAAAMAYPPPAQAIPFRLAQGSPVEQDWRAYNIQNPRLHDAFAAVIPPADFRLIRLNDMSMDPQSNAASWAPVKEAMRAWIEFDRKIKNNRIRAFTLPLRYADGGDFLEVFDARPGRQGRIVFRGQWREVCLAAMVARTPRQIADLINMDTADVMTILDDMAPMGILYWEGGRVLALPVASTPERAEARILGLFGSKTNK